MPEHVVSIEARPGHRGGTLPFTFSATCSCRGLATGQNAVKWILLAVQDHYAAVGLTGDVGNLIDGHAVRERIADEIDAGPGELRPKSWWSGFVRRGPESDRPPRVVIDFPDDTSDEQLARFESAWNATDGRPVECRRVGDD